MQWRNEGDKEGAIPLAPSHYGGAKSLWVAPKSPNNVTSTFFNAVHLLPKDLSFEHGGAKLASCPGCYLTLLRPCTYVTLKYQFERVTRFEKYHVSIWSFNVFQCTSITPWGKIIFWRQQITNACAIS